MREKNRETSRRILAYIRRYEWETGETPSIRAIAAGTGIPRPTVQRYLVALGEAGEISYAGGVITTDMSEKTSSDLVTVALLGEVACGLPSYAEEHIESYLRLPRALVGNGNCYLLRAKGESMVDVGITPGDLVLVREQATAEPGQIAVVLIGEEATLKRYYPEPEKHRIRLHPENTAMSDLYVRDALIQGVALRVIKELS
ncbi:MAG: transcriptional repressor LexA [Eubacteriales bacterium]